MATERIVLTDEWQQLTNGSETKILQSRDATFELFEGNDKPSKTLSGHTFSLVTVSPPAVVWVRRDSAAGKYLHVTLLP